ncbi:MAG: ABC transporter permease [Spirochaetaceae bacterium]|nr:ABC transporter permease [Spirochaetaceae bacterium]
MTKNNQSSSAGKTGIMRFFGRAMKNQAFSMFIILIAMWIVLAFMSPYFFTVSNIFEITLQTAVVAIIAAGETFITLTGGLDLSVGSTFACSAVLGGLVFQATQNLFLSLATTLLSGLVFGLINGLLITGLKVPPFIATLGMMGIARGFALIFSRGIPIFGLPPTYMWIGQGKLFNLIPIPTVIMVLVFIVAYLLLNYTRFGRFIFAIGSNTEAARLSGIPVAKVTIGIYAICGLLCGIASTIEAGRLGTIQPAGGNGYELLAIGAVVIGGTSTFGGEGSIIATLIGAIIVTTIRNGLNIIGVNAFWQQVVNGMIIIGAVATDQMRRHK